LDVSIAKIGSKGVFTEEIEEKLLDGSIDIAVHSAKDLSSDIHDELELIAFTEREEVNDVIVSFNKSADLKKDKLRIGTSATRRVAFLKHFFPQTEAVSIRVNRMGYNDMIVEKIETSYFVPAVGQGSIAIECHKKLSFDKKEILGRWVNHPATENCVRAERAFLKTLHGGCSIPAFGYAHYENDMIVLKAGIISLDGKQLVKVKKSASPEDTRELGKLVGEEVLLNGGAEILRSIRQQIPV
jgi:hydroxymethylbilane synthase